MRPPTQKLTLLQFVFILIIVGVIIKLSVLWLMPYFGAISNTP